jgi:hypothetical protein
MDTIILGQDLKLTLIGGINLGGGTAKMEFGKRSDVQQGIYSSLDATVDDQATCKCHREFVSANIDEAGIWHFWLRVIDGAGDTYISIKPFLIRVKRPGT